MADAEVLLEDWLESEAARDPVSASGMGLIDYDDQLGGFSASSFEARSGEDRRWAGRFDALHLEALPLAQRIDVTLALSRLAGRSVMEDWQAWRRDPSIYLDPCLEGVFSLFLHRLRPEPELVAAAVARLHQVPGALAAGRANLDPDVTPPLLVDRGLRSAQAGIVYVRDLLAAEVGDDRLRADLAEAGRHAATALEDFAAVLEGLLPRARGDWAIGEARYSGLLRDRELLGYGATEMHAMGLVAWNELDAEMTGVARELDPAAGGWHPVLTRLTDDRPRTPDEMLHAYRTACAEARDFLRDRDLVTLPEGEECQVVPSPPFERPILAVASYSSPPAFSTSTLGHFFVPYPPDGASAEEIGERLADNSFPLIPTVSVHEAYPGHHWHLTWSKGTDRRVRKMVHTPYFVEGWALYAERMMHEQGFFTEPATVLGHLSLRALRAARIVVDTALHTGDMTVEAAVRHMMASAGLTEPVARAEVDRYCAWPTQASSYLTGSLEIERIRARWLAEVGGSLRQFHDAIAAGPGLPLALTELALFEG